MISLGNFVSKFTVFPDNQDILIIDFGGWMKAKAHWNSELKWKLCFVIEVPRFQFDYSEEDFMYA